MAEYSESLTAMSSQGSSLPMRESQSIGPKASQMILSSKPEPWSTWNRLLQILLNIRITLKSCLREVDLIKTSNLSSRMIEKCSALMSFGKIPPMMEVTSSLSWTISYLISLVKWKKSMNKTLEDSPSQCSSKDRNLPSSQSWPIAQACLSERKNTTVLQTC